MSTLETDRKLPMRVKLGYSLLSTAPTIQILLQMYFLVYFYTNVLGISGTVAGIIILAARVWDFINDPLMGILVEKTEKPSGKCLYWMKRALIPIAIFMVLCYFAPDLSYPLKVVWALVTFICLGMTQTAFSIPKDSLQPKLTTDRKERAKLNSYIQIFSNILNAVVPAVTMPLVAVLSGYGEKSAFAKLAAIYAVVYLIMGAIGLKACKGYEIEDDVAENGVTEKEKVSTKEMFGALFQNKISMVVLLIQVVKMLLSSIAGATLVYFCTYNLGNVNVMSVTTSLSVVFSMIPAFFLVLMHKKFGNAGSGVLGAVVGIVPYVCLYLTHVSNPMEYIVCEMIACLGLTTVTAVLPQCLMDSLDYGEWKTGKKHTSIVMSVYGIGTKIGLAFGGSVAAVVIDLIGFDPEAATQSTRVLNTFFNLTIGGQLCVYIAMFVLFFYLTRIEKRLPQMREEIAARKANHA